MSEQAQRQLERGASKFEDISLGENRPTQLVKRYGNLYSEARLDAMDALDELPDMADADDLKVKLLLSIVVVCLSGSLFPLLFAKSDQSVQLDLVDSPPPVILSRWLYCVFLLSHSGEVVSPGLVSPVPRHDFLGPVHTPVWLRKSAL